jgi:IclR family transcriptional regulator, KDG regulon repressor
MDQRHERNFLKTLARGLTVLAAFTPIKPELSLTDIAEALGDDPSTANRFVYTLEELGYLERDADTKLYHVTTKIYALGISLTGPRNLKKVALPYLERLRNRTGETALLSVRDGSDIVVIEVVETRYSLAPRGWVGGRSPVYCAAMGKAILAYLPEKEVAPLLDLISWTKLTPYTIVDRLEFLADLERTRQRGWAINNEENSLGVVSVGAPVFSVDHRVAAAVCLDVPSARIPDPAYLEKLAVEVMSVARDLSTEPGYMFA